MSTSLNNFSEILGRLLNRTNPQEPDVPAHSADDKPQFHSKQRTALDRKMQIALDLDDERERRKAAHENSVIPTTKEPEPVQVEVIPDENQPAHQHSALVLAHTVWYGLCERYRNIFRFCTEASEVFHLASLLTILSVLLARRVWVNLPRPIYANLYTILIGTTSKARKSTAYNLALDLMWLVADLLKLDLCSVYGLSSAEGLAEQMQGPDGFGKPTIIIEDEFRSLMEKAQQKGVSNLIPKLTELYNAGEKFDVPTRSNPISVKKPLPVLISATTKTWMVDSTDVTDAASGFLNRFLLFEGESTACIAIPDSINMEEFRRLAADIAECIQQAEGEFQLSPEAKSLYERFYRQFFHRQGSETALNLTERMHVHVIKISLIFAVLNRHQQIEGDDMARAILVAQFCGGVAISLAPQLGLSRTAKTEHRIMAHLRKNGPSKSREIYRSLNLSADECHRAMQSLVKTQEITETPTGVYRLA